jgi:hypothetical protein
MPPKKQVPAPIDRPVARAYLRNFTGWSTAYPPGRADPTSLRLMENMMVNRDGSVRVRPGLRYLSYLRQSDDSLVGLDVPCVGTHEPFFLTSDGSKAYLFAVREADETVGFRVLARIDGMRTVYPLDAEGIDFDIVGGTANINFTAKTTYVKYLQIDNKVFALSNAGEPFRLFTVGESKTVKKLNPILVPEWDVDDKLTVVHPTQAWIDGNLPAFTRTNRINSPAMNSLVGWTADTSTALRQTDEQHQTGKWSAKVSSLPARSNLMPNPLHDVHVVVDDGWNTGVGVDSISILAGPRALQAHMDPGDVGRVGQVFGPLMDVDASTEYQVCLDINATSMSKGGIKIKWMTTTGAQIGDIEDRTMAFSPGRRVVNNIGSPKNATQMRIWVYGIADTRAAETFSFNNVLVSKDDEATGIFSGYSGTNYFWVGTAGNSKSVFHPPADVKITITVKPVFARDWTTSAYFRSDGTIRACQVDVGFARGEGGGDMIVNSPGTPVNDSSTAWTRLSETHTAPADTTVAYVALRVKAVPRGEWHYLDSVMFEAGATAGVWFSGDSADTDLVHYSWKGEEGNSWSVEETFTDTGPVPPAAPNTTKTLTSTDATRNMYSFGFFYTFSNEIGESAASQITVVKTQRGWNMWKWETPNAASEPSGTGTNNPGACADQLVAYMTQAVFDAAVNQGAISWSLYAFTWSDQNPVPVQALKVDEQLIDDVSHPYIANCWLRITPQTNDTGELTVPVPTKTTRYNYSQPGNPAQGLVAADRMVMVGDETNPAMIRWTSNQQGEYTNFSSKLGGGYKTLTSGNLFLPACVKLWQNPQSVDTLTILCLGVDGHSTGYYMQPATLSTSSEQTQIMGFEETTATPGTVSPYGCEVLNNALYHPIDEQIMKSTANNYNISHKSITEQVQNAWMGLTHKQRIVSCQHDNRLYFLVFNPDGPDLPKGCMGNEVWVYDTALGSDKGTWSRWLTPGCSLRKVEQGNRVYMSLVHPDGIFYFDDHYAFDDVVDPTKTFIYQRGIAWSMETNTQGANKAHDAWCHLQQANVTLGNFFGTLRYGLRGRDINGMDVDISKTVRSLKADEDFELDGQTVKTPWDVDDYLLIRRDLKEWFFYAESLTDPMFQDQIMPSYGQLSLIQYRYTPVSVNVGIEFGSVETFEYATVSQWQRDQSVSMNGIPVPYIDTRRP